jgi:hypothetical protein
MFIAKIHLPAAKFRWDGHETAADFHAAPTELGLILLVDSFWQYLA